jgi:DNA-binding NarL/FixJ family response regulator
MFVSMGADGYAERAGAGLLATSGAPVAARPAPASTTHRRGAGAELASEGASNNEIAAHLSLSASTVEYHLKNVCRKVNVTSRTQLARLVLERKGDLDRLSP